MILNIIKRQGIIIDDDDGDDDRVSNTAIAIKWAVVAAIFLFFLLWFVGGYMHAQKRLKKGLPPLAYHRFLVPRHQRSRFVPQAQFAYYERPNGYGEGYPLQAYPPPAYNHAEHVPPPVYQPPEGASKADPAQDWVAPPPGPPPGHRSTGESSSAMQSVPLNQATVGQDIQSSEPPSMAPKQSLMTRFKLFK